MSVPKHMRRSWALAVGLGVLLAPAAARAEFAPATLLSGSALLQFDNANSPSLSADGRYAVFQGSVAGNPGVYRRDLENGALELVAGGASTDPEARCAATPAHPLVACDAAAPSVSADGRYVVFTTTADLQPLELLPSGQRRGEPAADEGCPEVYVRDMEKAPGAAGAYTLAVALDGSEEGIAFTQRYASCAARSGFALAGAQAASNVAISADGRRVVFTVLSESDLAGPETAPGQVAVRDLDTDTTTLLTTNTSGGPVAGGGAFPDVSTLVEGGIGAAGVGIEEFQAPYGDQAAGSTAAISADGSAVTWLGTNVAEQVSGAEAQREPQLTLPPSGNEAEPLWRRIGAGGNARRLLAGAGLGFFFTPNPVSRPDPVEAGSLRGTQHMDFIAPALSADGDAVAVVATAPPLAAQPSLQGLTHESEFSSDAYLVQVGDDPATAPQVQPLTEISSYAVPEPQLGDVKDLAISPDGTRVAFDTTRTSLYLPSLALLGQPAPAGEPVVYEADVARGTLQRVTSTYNGSQLDGPVGLLSFDGEGQTLAFASEATNLFFGDAVRGWEVYETHELVSSSPQPTPQQLGTAPTLGLPTPEWDLEVTAAPASDGTVLVRAQVPGAGRLLVRAGAQLPSSPARRARGARRPHSRAHHSRAHGSAHASSRGSRHRAGRRSSIPVTTMAQGAMLAQAPSELSLRLRVGAPYRRLVDSPSGLYAVLQVTFAAPGNRTLTRQIPVTFRHAKPPKRLPGAGRSARTPDIPRPKR